MIAQIHKESLNYSIKKPKSYVKNSFTFMDSIKNLTIPDNHILLSLDVTSLYTNIPLKLLIDGLDKRSIPISKTSPIPLNEIIDAITFLFDNTYFIFLNVIYKQLHGTPMGSPLSQILADMVLEDLEKSCIKKLNFTPVFFKRYVDDIVTCIPAKEIDKF